MKSNKPSWSSLLQGAESASKTVIFSGGACNAIDARGRKIRNVGRDKLNDWLSQRGIPFFDPQIHPDSHGRGYEYAVDGPAEQTARSVAKGLVYEVSGDTMGGVTHLEALNDARLGKPVILWFSGPLDEKKNPLFRPTVPSRKGVWVKSVVEVHLAQYEDNGNKLRKNLVAFIGKLPNVTVCYTLSEVQQAIEAIV